MPECVAMFQGELKQPVFAAQIKLFADVRSMRVHSPGTDVPFSSNFFGGLSLGNAIENAPF